MVRRTALFVFEEAFDWPQFGFVILSGVFSYAVVCYLIRRRERVVEGAEREHQPPRPDIAAFGAVAITDALIYFVTLRLASFFFSALYGGAMPLARAPLIIASRLLLFLLFSFLFTIFISKALLPTGFRQATLISGLKIPLQLVLLFFYILLFTLSA